MRLNFLTGLLCREWLLFKHSQNQECLRLLLADQNWRLLSRNRYLWQALADTALINSLVFNVFLRSLLPLSSIRLSASLYLSSSGKISCLGICRIGSSISLKAFFVTALDSLHASPVWTLVQEFYVLSTARYCFFARSRTLRLRYRLIPLQVIFVA